MSREELEEIVINYYKQIEEAKKIEKKFLLKTKKILLKQKMQGEIK